MYYTYSARFLSKLSQNKIHYSAQDEASTGIWLDKEVFRSELGKLIDMLLFSQV